MYTEISKCRICGSNKLAEILDLGNQALTGIFPKNRDEFVGQMPLVLVKCFGESDSCGLVQLKHTGDLSQMYGMNYGYRSGLNASMVKHLHSKVQRILSTVQLNPEDLVIDIGSNDSTTLQAYPKFAKLVGIDPTGVKFKSYYPEHIQLIPNFFDSTLVKQKFGNQKAKVITAFSMFYDLEDPTLFLRQVSEVLDPQGVFVFEQSYLPTMLKMNSYDTICHEHLEYYSLKQIQFMVERVGLKILDVEFNDINGGSFSLTAARKESPLIADEKLIHQVLKDERELGLDTLNPYKEFKENINQTRDELLRFVTEAKKQGKKVFGYGASTKGNVLLQYCNMTADDLTLIAEVNENKFGCYTPGTKIPIVSEKEAKELNPDYFMVLPWHFKDNIIQRESTFLRSGGKLVFPLPNVQIV
jgi:hypothetical protein